MKILHRYIGLHFIGPFFIGVAAFVAILLGIGQISDAVKLVVRDHLPVVLVTKSFLLRIPTVVALTMPMATVFAALMSSGELSGHGEITAMRAGGISVWRLSGSVLIAGVLVSMIAFGFNEAVGPYCNNKATTMLFEWLTENHDEDKPVMLRVPDDGEARLLVYSDNFNLKRREMTGVSIVEFRGDQPPNLYYAERAEWAGDTWELKEVTRKEHTPNGYREFTSGTMEYPIGKTPDEIQRHRKKRPEDLTLPQLLSESKVSAAAEDLWVKAGYRRSLILLQHFHIRIAAPWAAVCFAILGFPLGMRPQRTSTGVGFGISLAIIFVYYIVFNLLQAFGEQGALPPVLAAWIPNMVVLGVGLGLMIESSR